MSHIITLAEIKGGTGKTTTAAALAQAATLDGKKVLVIDLDGQGTISYLFGADTTAPGAWDMLQGTPINETIQETKHDIDIIAGAPDLYAITLDNIGGIYALTERIEPIVKQYDLILIDTPPALNDLTFNAFQASTGILISMYADEGSADGLILTTDYAKEIKRTNKKLKVLGCIVTKFDNRANINKRLRDLCKEVAEKNKCKYLGEIRQGIAVQEAHAYGKNLFTYAPKSKPAQDYMQLYNYLTETKAI